MELKTVEWWSINEKILWHKDYYINWVRIWRQFQNNQCVVFYKNWKSDWYYPKEYTMRDYKLIK